MIRVEHKFEGLFCFIPPMTCVSCTFPNLVHQQRLEHLSLEKVCLFVPSFSTTKSFQCEFCPSGKHTCTRYGPRFNKRVALWYVLVYSNIWGSNHVFSTLEYFYFATLINYFMYWIFQWRRIIFKFSLFFKVFFFFCRNWNSVWLQN